LKRSFAMVLPLCLFASSAQAQLSDPGNSPSPLAPYTKCSFLGGLNQISITRAPGLPMARPVETARGRKTVSVMDGYRVMLGFENTDPFVNLKIEKSVRGHYDADKAVVFEQMQLMSQSAPAGAVASLERGSLNGIQFAALNSETLSPGVVSIYTFFDDKREVMATAYLLNQVPQRRAFNDIHQYRALRDRFIADLTRCMAALSVRDP
jgi:hypothetical protein